MAGERPLRVLYVQGASERAGAETTLLGRLRHLPAAGVEPLVASLAEGPFVDEIRELSVPVTVLASSPPRVRALWRMPATVRAVARAARALNVDILDGWGEKMSFVAGWAARLARRPAVMTLHDVARRTPAASLVQLGAATARHDATIVPSRWMAESFRKAWRLQPEVIPNALPLEAFPSEPAPLPADARWDDDVLVVGVFGRLVKWKGQHTFLRAAALILEREPRARFLVVGGTLYGLESAYPDELRRLADSLGLGDRVYFTGYRPDQLRLMLACDVVCHTSLENDPSPLVVQEAMALGRAVVATRTGGPEESVADGRTGLLVAPGSEQALAAAVARLLENPELRADLGERARRNARETHDGDRVAGEVAALYRRLVEAR